MELLDTTYLTKVPDHHDRIIWRNQYYHLTTTGLLPDVEVVAQAGQEPVAWMLDTPNGIIRLERFVGESQKCEGLWIPLYAAPVACPKCAEREKLLAPKRGLFGISKSLEYALAESTEHLLKVIDERDALQAKVAEQSAEIERLRAENRSMTEDVTHYQENEQSDQATIAQQAERIAKLEQTVMKYQAAIGPSGHLVLKLREKVAEQAALIEKCEEALGYALASHEGRLSPYHNHWSCGIREALATIAAQKGGIK